MRKYRTLFIDLDDTLWDTFQNNKECLEELYVAHSFGQHYASFEAFFDRYMPHNLHLWAQYRNGEIDKQTLILERFAYMTRPMGITDKREILKLNHEFLQRTTTKSRLVPGTLDLLEYLHPHYRLIILSNGFREVQSEKLNNSGLAPYFEQMILSEDAQVQKPHRGIFDFALQCTHACRTNSLMIGDSWEADIVGAHHSHIDQLWFNPEGTPPTGFTPTYTVSSLAEIKAIL